MEQRPELQQGLLLRWKFFFFKFFSNKVQKKFMFFHQISFVGWFFLLEDYFLIKLIYLLQAGFALQEKKIFLNVSLVQVCKAYPLPALLPEGSQLKKKRKSEISGLNAGHSFLQAIWFFLEPVFQ